MAGLIFRSNLDHVCMLYQLGAERKIDRYLMFYAQSTAKGHMRVKQNAFLPQVTIIIHYLIHIPPLKIWRKLGGNEMNEPGR